MVISTILVKKVVLESLIKTFKVIIVLINTSRTTWPTKFECNFLVSQTICFKMLILFFKKVLMILR